MHRIANTKRWRRREEKRREKKRKDNAETQSTLGSAEKNREALSAAAGDVSLRIGNRDSRRRFPRERKAGEVEQTEWRRARPQAGEGVCARETQERVGWQRG